ncbi:beta-1,6-N-acetylglucosaminyltransferase [Niabella sp.]|uniref:beta-1,6-N-acetylglucosaminyltransferase n=1 Tax=Niabella sp. TaxID=1962976 RepID=UPI002638D9A1|nr:beta-1,6-N-acetylglucosaminyltransferase [Niabella sp.]
MKQAILITGYKNIHSFIDIINCFDKERFSFYLHIDKRSPLDTTPLQAYRNVFISTRYAVTWGGENHLKAILLLAKTALQDPDNAFFHLITAEDFPVKPMNAFYELDLTRNYLSFSEMPAPFWGPDGGMDRIRYYQFYNWMDVKKPYRRAIIYRLLKFQKILGFKRAYPANFPKLYGGATYWSLNRDALRYVIDYTDQNSAFLRRFNHTWCSEEIYFQTLILNSPFAHTVVNDDLRYIDWSGKRGYPAFLDETDFPQLIASGKLFARKINDSKSGNLKQLLIQYLHPEAG